MAIDPFKQDSCASVVPQIGDGSRPQPFTSSAPGGGGETPTSPKGPISAGNDGSTEPRLGA